MNEKLENCTKQLAMIQESLSSETKSTAGDKHETGRAMIQLEREQLGQQLKKIEIEKLLLHKINPDLKPDRVGMGSLVKTSEFNYFISISLGKIEVENQVYFAVSIDSPIGQLLYGNQKGDLLNFQGRNIEILEIL